MSNKLTRSEPPRRGRPTRRAQAAVNGSAAHGVDLGVLPSLLGYQLRLAPISWTAWASTT
jgi:hypothetical protein